MSWTDALTTEDIEKLHAIARHYCERAECIDAHDARFIDAVSEIRSASGKIGIMHNGQA